MKNLSGRTAAIIAGAVVVVIVLATLGGLQYRQSVHNNGASLQREVITLSRDVDISLSNCLDQSTVAAQVTQNQQQAVKNILISAVSARYVTPSGGTTSADGVLKSGSFISALAEAYPQIDVSTWKNLMAVAVGCRDNVADAQEHLQAVAGQFETWTQTGSIFSRGIHASFPTNALYAYDASGQEIYGEAALQYLTRTILTSQAQQAINSGTMPNQNLFGSSSPSATPSPSASR